jgi:DUF4097 and DUF4098 domain-containing protein YvlB
MPTTIQLPAGPSTVPAPRRRITRYAVVAGAVLILGVPALIVANSVMTKHDQTHFIAEGVRVLVIEQDAGDITLVQEPTAGQVSVTTTRNWSWQQPLSAHTVTDGVLRLTGNSPSFPGLGTSDINQEVSVPRGVTIQIGVSAGNIRATDIDAPQFEVKTDSGSIDATNINATSFSAITSSGNVQASLYGAVDRVNARTSSGSVELSVPNAAYNVDADTSSGHVRIEVTDDPNAARLISAHTSSGDVTIHGR